MNYRNLVQLYKNMGPRYFSYRIGHELEKRLGLLKAKHPVDLQLKNKINKIEWLKILDRDDLFSHSLAKVPHEELEELKFKAEKILSGEVQFFNAEWLFLGKEYNWTRNPSNNFQYDIKNHWSEIADFSKEAGDIKYVWEKSRFSWLLTLIKYDYHFDQDLSEFVFSEIESWIDNNPINCGPNWRCSQEISLRIFNWFIVMSYYRNSSSFTEKRWMKLQDVIYASLHHVYHHINFSRIAVRNNHAITETLFLSLSEILFPFINETKIWSKKGRIWFEEEIEYQIYEDGTFLQFSMNYHRVVLQLLTLGISISEKADKPFSDIVYSRAYKSIEFLYNCLQDENGWLPNYGSNDGALFFPWSDCDYRDYRPQINSLHFLLTGKYLFTERKFSEEIEWWGIKPLNHTLQVLQRSFGIKKFEIGGYVIIRESKAFTFIRCGSHKDRPAQADNLHLDIWVNGKNILRDSGTYKYNTNEELVNFFTGSMSHNTVVVNDESQMQKGSRFIWYYWTQLDQSTISEDNDFYYFEGRIRAYQFLNKEAIHSRKIKKDKTRNVWIVEDSIFGLDNYPKKQIWHFEGNSINFNAVENECKLQSHDEKSFNSNYYGVMQIGTACSYDFEKNIKTTITIK